MAIFTTDESSEESNVEDFNNNGDVLEFGKEDDEDEEDKQNTKQMDEKTKFKMLMPIVMSIANLSSLHGTKRFLEYKEDLELVEKRIRRGNKIFLAKDRETEERSEAEVETEEESEIEIHDGMTVGTGQNSGDLDDTVPEDDYIPEPIRRQSRFDNISFKESLKTKGRPKKKKGTQVTFNKTALDRKARPKPKGSKKVAKKPKTDFIDDTGEPEDEDEESFSDGTDSGESDASDAEVDIDSDDKSDSELSLTDSKCNKCEEEIEDFDNIFICSSCLSKVHIECYKDGGCKHCAFDGDNLI